MHNPTEKLFMSEYERTKELVQAPDWYIEFGRSRKIRDLGIGAVQAAFNGSILRGMYAVKNLQIDIFEQLLQEDAVRLGHPGKEQLDDQDKDRESISQIVIHHSSRSEGIELSKLNAMHLLSLYVPVYNNPSVPVLNDEGGLQPIYSGHFDVNGHQVFYGYHWKVGQDGIVTRLLDDSAIGWHAGNWDVNKRSVGISIDDDLAHKAPTMDVLDSVANLIRRHYPTITPTETSIVGHNEVTKSSTDCPGDLFLSSWKEALLQRLRD